MVSGSFQGFSRNLVSGPLRLDPYICIVKNVESSIGESISVNTHMR